MFILVILLSITISFNRLSVPEFSIITVELNNRQYMPVYSSEFKVSSLNSKSAGSVTQLHNKIKENFMENFNSGQ